MELNKRKKRGGVEGTGELRGTVTWDQPGLKTMGENGSRGWVCREAFGGRWEAGAGRSSGATMWGKRCPRMGARQTEAGRATQERKQRPLLEQTGRN